MVPLQCGRANREGGGHALLKRRGTLVAAPPPEGRHDGQVVLVAVVGHARAVPPRSWSSVSVTALPLCHEGNEEMPPPTRNRGIQIGRRVKEKPPSPSCITQ